MRQKDTWRDRIVAISILMLLLAQARLYPSTLSVLKHNDGERASDVLWRALFLNLQEPTYGVNSRGLPYRFWVPVNLFIYGVMTPDTHIARRANVTGAVLALRFDAENARPDTYKQGAEKQAWWGTAHFGKEDLKQGLVNDFPTEVLRVILAKVACDFLKFWGHLTHDLVDSLRQGCALAEERDNLIIHAAKRGRTINTGIRKEDIIGDIDLTGGPSWRTIPDGQLTIGPYDEEIVPAQGDDRSSSQWSANQTYGGERRKDGPDKGHGGAVRSISH